MSLVSMHPDKRPLASANLTWDIFCMVSREKEIKRERERVREREREREKEKEKVRDI